MLSLHASDLIKWPVILFGKECLLFVSVSADVLPLQETQKERDLDPLVDLDREKPLEAQMSAQTNRKAQVCLLHLTVLQGEGCKDGACFTYLFLIF